MNTTGLELYTRTAGRGAAVVIGAYSTSFGLASRLLPRAVRRHIAHLYALVRIADEIVDGPAEAAGLDADDRRQRLDELEAETERAMRTGYSANLVVHAFAASAHELGIGTALTRPFFASMRRDLDPVDFGEQEFADYVHGSAEVVGLMCLSAFGAERPIEPARRAALEHGACRLGAAFQKINFVRDLGEDYRGLGRSYLPGVDPAAFDEAAKRRVLDDVDADLAAAAAVIPELPPRCRRAVAAAHGLFAELSARARRTPAARLAGARLSVPKRRKLSIAVRAFATARPGRFA